MNPEDLSVIDALTGGGFAEVREGEHVETIIRPASTKDD